MPINGVPKRLLCIVGSMNVGGAETFLMKVYRVLDKKKYQMDFYCMSQEKGYYEEEILSLGGKIFHSVPKTKRPIKSFINLKKLVKEESYQYVIRSKEHSLATLDLLAAKMGGSKILIQRSSNTKSTGKISGCLHLLFKFLPMMIPNIKIAPSTEAAEYTFGKKCVKKNKVNIIKNAIPIEKFIFNKETRDKIRKELRINDNFVVGHVGRFSNQKNHAFLIDVFNEIVKRNSNSTLLLVGDGELELELKNKIKKLGLIEKVVFTGVRSDIPDVMMAMDVLIFPSYFEGMPNVIIEAQATSLPSIISDNITREVKITELVKCMSLNTKAEKWAEVALQNKDKFIRRNMEKEFIDNGYDILNVTKKIEKILFV